MSKEPIKYFISYVNEYKNVHSTEVIRDTFIANIDDIRSLEEDIKKDMGSSSITIINYRVF
jgi:hypothetical protein